jgi:PBP1b-binding outer membrane lipoprotein LpoB
MKKILALIFAVCMLSCLLVGCDGNEESQGSQETTAETTTEPPTKRELTATEFGEIVNSIASYSLETQYSDNEKIWKAFLMMHCKAVLLLQMVM